MHIIVHESLTAIDAAQWNAMLHDNNPFMRHEFLLGLEQSQCVCAATGWQPTHIAAYADASCATLLGAMPCYIKNHSYGEYIFDWVWADAHQRHGINYYPKLLNAIPFTPATGPRWLIKDHADSAAIASAMVEKAVNLVAELELSSFHCLFLEKHQFDLLGEKKFLQRHSTQFHWHNNSYSDFSEFLARMSAKKRKNIRRERRRIRESGIKYRWLSGDDLGQDAVEHMYSFYSATIAYYGAQAYLNKPFFQYLAESFNRQTLFIFAEFQNKIIAGGLYFISDNTLYGRYWGASHNFHSVHFETCYYQAIEWCIENGYQVFEAGAQGEHKIARGLEPSPTYSSHWIRHPEFRNAIDDYLKHEQSHSNQYARAMRALSPFKTEL